jgi:tRNA modification GTPase
MVYGKLIHPKSKALIDRALAVFFPAPNSFTGEDTVEIFGHGGATAPRLILEAVVATGARLANPGEFTQRAFINDRLSLDQAEAVADLVAAQSEAEAALAARHLEGALSAKVNPIIAQTLEVQAELVAILDFEEDWNEAERAKIISALESILAETIDLCAIRKNQRVFRDGLKIVLTGLPNAGKSSLFNALLGRDRALVSPRPGTTRDYLEATVSWDGLRVELVDTAGLGSETADELEEKGQELAARELETADIIVWLRSVSEPGSSEPPIDPRSPKIIPIWSKADLRNGPLPKKNAPSDADNNADNIAVSETDNIADNLAASDDDNIASVSSLTGEGLDNLKLQILRQAGLVPGLRPEIVPNLRQQTALEMALERISAAHQALIDFLPPDIAALELSAAIESFNQITGRVYTEDILSQVFNKFCVGK